MSIQGMVLIIISTIAMMVSAIGGNIEYTIMNGVFVIANILIHKEAEDHV